MMDEEVALHDALPALLECAEALEKIANEAQDIARAALQALAEGGAS
jgi:uncharacterized protein with PhoU and TrkA domain